MRKRVVIVGGGFAGSYIVKKLESKFDVTLIDTKEYFEFTPGILRTIAKPERVKKIQVLHTHYLKNARVEIGEVIEVSKKNVLLKSGRKFGYDYLIIASGSSYDFPIKEQNIVVVTRAKHLRDCHRELDEAKRVLIIGGGLVGVELAGEILDRYKNKKISIVQASNRLIPRNCEKSRKYVTNFLEKGGVEIVYSERLLSKSGGKYVTKKGREFDADLVFLCTGIKPNYELMKKNFTKVLNEVGQIKVNDYLQVEGFENIFVPGDVNSFREEKTAQNAELQGKVVANNICALDKGHDLKKYKSKARVMVISLGRFNGVFEYKNFVLSGKIPALLKWVIERMEMMKHRRFG